MIVDLCNPSLKPRHWIQIEDIIEHKINPDDATFNLKMLQDLQVFDFAEAIQDISGQASTEASLEAILRKVCAIIPTHSCCPLLMSGHVSHAGGGVMEDHGVCATSS